MSGCNSVSDREPTASMHPPRRIFALAEVQRAAHALRNGEFRCGHSADLQRPRARTKTWSPQGRAVLVVGATGHSGTTTIAVGLTTAAGGIGRLVEAGPMHSTGLACASTAELGVTGDGWRRGTRDDGTVLIERTTQALRRPDDVIPPAPTDRELTIVDSAWDLPTLSAARGWLSDLAAQAPIVIVTSCTVPGLRALDVSLTTVNRPDRIWAAVVGPARKKWPRAVAVASTAAIDHLYDGGRLHTVPTVRSLSIAGLNAEPLPPQVAAACDPLLDQLVDHWRGTTHAPV